MSPHRASCRSPWGTAAEPARCAAWPRPERPQTRAPQAPGRRCRHRTAKNLRAAELRTSVEIPWFHYRPDGVKLLSEFGYFERARLCNWRNKLADVKRPVSAIGYGPFYCFLRLPAYLPESPAFFALAFIWMRLFFLYSLMIAAHEDAEGFVAALSPASGRGSGRSFWRSRPRWAPACPPVWPPRRCAAR